MTTELEKLILSGDAQYRNYSIFGSAAGTVPCPDGKQIILTDIDFTGGALIRTVFPFGIVFMKFYGIEQSSENTISFYLPKFDPNAATAPGQYFKNIYFPFSSPCRIDICTLIQNALPAVDYTAMPTSAKDKPVPNGYGTTIAVVRSVDFNGGGDFYIPQGVDIAGFAPLTAGMKNQPYPAIVAGVSDLPTIANVDDAFCVNIGYVILNKPILPYN